MRRSSSLLCAAPLDPRPRGSLRGRLARAAGRRVRLTGLASLIAVLFLAGVAEAEQIVLGIEQGISGQSNLFRSTVRPIAEGTYVISPFVRVLRRGGKIEYLVEYMPSYEVYFDNSDLNGLDHFFRGNIVYNVLPVSKLRLRADVADYRAVRAVTADGPAGIPDVTPQTTGDITRSFVYLDYEHQVTPSTVATGVLGFQSYQYTTPNNADSLGFGGDARVVHSLQSNFGLGGSVLASHRRFDSLNSQPGSQNTVVNANLVALFEPTPSLFIELSGGPAVIFTRRDAAGPQIVNRFFGADTPPGPVVGLYVTDPAAPRRCAEIRGEPVLLTCPLALDPSFSGSFAERVAVTYDPGEAPTRADQDIVTGFATMEIRKEDSWGYVSARYFRGEDASAGIGATTIRDSVTLTWALQPLFGFDLRVRGNWNQRKTTGASDRVAVSAGPSPIISAGGIPVAEANGLIDTGISSQVEITQYWADARATREIYDRLQLELGFRYLRQERIERPSALTTSFDNIVGSLMLRYEFAPIEF
jgi:hypothetical protein